MNIFVGNLSYQSTEEGLQSLFAQHGEVSSVRIMTDKFTGRSRGFGFVEMPNDSEAASAIGALNDTEFMTRKLVVNEGRPRTEGGGNRY